MKDEIRLEGQRLWERLLGLEAEFVKDRNLTEAKTSDTAWVIMAFKKELKDYMAKVDAELSKR